MALGMPPYIAEAGLDSPEIRFVWDEWGSKRSIYKTERDPQLISTVRPLSQRCRIALVNGVAEWIVYRFRTFLDTDLPYDALEAGWAGLVDRKYLLPFDMSEDEGWSGPVKGVIRRALLFVHDNVDLAWANGETIHLCVKIINLARYVLPNTSAFEAWLAEVLGRLIRLSTADTADYLGDVVPREALDVLRPFDPSTAEALIRKFLSELTPGRNAFLATPKTMLDWGFRGEPYTFDQALDRETRKITSVD